MPITQVITALPPAPTTAVPATFAALAQAFAVALPTFGNELNALVTQINTAATGLNAAVSGSAFDIDYTFSTTTADADPGNGFIRLNNATQNLATAIYADLLDRLGVDWTSGLNVVDDSTSTIKGYLMLRKADDGTKWILFSVTSMTSPAGYRSLVVAVVASSAANPFANGDFVTLGFVRTGDKGDTGNTGATGPVTELQVQNQTYTGFTTTGTGTAYALTPAPVTSAYAANKSFFVTFHAASGTNPTLNINGLGATLQLVKQLADGSYANILAGDIPINHRSRVTLLSGTAAWVETVPAIAPAFSAYQSAAQNLAQNVVTKFQFQTEEFDTAGAFDAVTNYRFQPTIPGYYQVSGGFAIATTQTGLQLLIYKNGAAYKNLQFLTSNAASGAYGAALVFLNGTTDYIELFGSQAAAAQNTSAGAASTYFQAAFVRGA